MTKTIVNICGVILFTNLILLRLDEFQIVNMINESVDHGIKAKIFNEKFSKITEFSICLFDMPIDSIKPNSK